MTDLAGPATAEVAACRGATRSYVLDIVIPVYNEERDLAGSVRRLHQFLATEVPYPSRITVADNASTDSTLAVAQELVQAAAPFMEFLTSALSLPWSSADNAAVREVLDVESPRIR